MLMCSISYWFTAMTKHSDKHWGKEEKCKRGGDKWERERESARKMDGVCGCCWQCRYPALPLSPSLPLSFPPLWPTPLLQSHGSGLNHCIAGGWLQLAWELASYSILWNTVQAICDDNLHSSQRSEHAEHLKAKQRAGDCCHMLLVCDILSNSTPHPEVNHGCASLPTFSLHTHKSACTYARTSPYTTCMQPTHNT